MIYVIPGEVGVVDVLQQVTVPGGRTDGRKERRKTTNKGGE